MFDFLMKLTKEEYIEVLMCDFGWSEEEAKKYADMMF